MRDRTAAEFGVTGALGDRVLIEPKRTHHEIPEPNESMIQTFCFIMDNLTTDNRRQGDYHSSHRGTSPAYRYTHPEINEATIPALASYLNMASQPYRPLGWERMVEEAVNSRKPVHPQPWNTLPYYGSLEFPEGGGTAVSRQLEVLALTAASRIFDSPSEEDAAKVRTSMERLRNALSKSEDRAGTAGPMIMDAVREMARMPMLSGIGISVADMTASTVDRITDELEVYCAGGARELPFALRFDGRSLEDTWRRWSTLEEDERTAEVKGTIMSLGGDTVAAPSGRSHGLDVTALDPYSDADWRTCDAVWAELCRRHAEEAVKTRSLGRDTYMYRFPLSEEAFAEAEKIPFRMDWNTPEAGMVRMYVNALGFGCEKVTKSGTSLLVLENPEMYVKGMETGYTDICILGDGMLRSASECTGEDGRLADVDGRILSANATLLLKRHWDMCRDRLAEWGRGHADRLPDDERHLLHSMTEKERRDSARPMKQVHGGRIRPDLASSAELIGRSSEKREIPLRSR